MPVFLSRAKKKRASPASNSAAAHNSEDRPIGLTDRETAKASKRRARYRKVAVRKTEEHNHTVLHIEQCAAIFQ